MRSSKNLLASRSLAALALALALAFVPLAACQSTPPEGGDEGSAGSVELTEEQQKLIEEARAAEEEEERLEAERDAAENDNEGQATTNSGDGDVVTKVTNLDGTVSVINTEDLFTDRDIEGGYDDDHTVNVTLRGTSADADGTGATVLNGVLNITEGGTYILSGDFNGSVLVDVSKDSNDKVQLALDGVSITCDNSAAIYVREADKVFVTLVEGSDNSLSCSGFEPDGDINVDGAIFSRDDMTINGEGSLSISSSDNGIVAKDELKLVSGTVSIAAEGHGIQANDSVAIRGGSWTVAAGADGIHCSNSEDLSWGYIYIEDGDVSVACTSDGLDASSALQINGGNVTISAGDDGVHSDHDTVINGGVVNVTKSYEGIEGGTITIAGGEVYVKASDDGFNASGVSTGTSNGGGGGWGPFGGGPGGFSNKQGADLVISGGLIVVESEGDGIDSNGNVTMTGGQLYVSGPSSSMNGALDFGDGYEGIIQGGICIAAGTTSMPENWGSKSTQGAALVNVSGNAGDTVTVTDDAGNVLAKYTVTKKFGCVVVSAPGMVKGGTYTVKSSGGSSVTFTLSNITYSNTGFGGFGGSGGPFGGGPGPFGG